MEKLILTTQEELCSLIEGSVRNAMLRFHPAEHSEYDTKNASRYLTISEAATYLNLAKQTLYGFTSNRSIPFIKRAKRLLFQKSDLDSWLAQGKKPSVEQIRAGITTRSVSKI